VISILIVFLCYCLSVRYKNVFETNDVCVFNIIILPDVIKYAI